jgi:hypothetical protein
LNNKDLFSGGKIKVSKENLLDHLRLIFSGTPEADKFYNTLKKSKDGKEIFQLLSEGFAENSKKLEQELQEI